MADNSNKGGLIALILALAKATSLKYESIGIANITQGSTPNTIVFTLVNGDTHTVTFTYSASGIAFVPTAEITSTNVQAAIEEVFTDLANRLDEAITSVVDMPEATEANAGQEVHYLGESTSEFEQNHFYENQEIDGVWTWVDVTPGGAGIAAAYDSTRAYTLGETFLYGENFGITIVEHEAEEYDTAHNKILANQVWDSENTQYRDLGYFVVTLRQEIQDLRDGVLQKPVSPTENVITYVDSEGVQHFAGLDPRTMEIKNNRLSSGIELVEV